MRVQSNCVAITPLETEFGRKRQVDQSSCNKDYACAKGFCPSFVSVEGGALREPAAVESGLPELLYPARKLPLDRPFGVVLTGVGGTGIVTIGALLAMAAHLEGKGCGIIDMLGMAQKGGAVTSHIMLAEKPGDITAIRVAPGQANLVLGCDMVVSAGDQILSLVGCDRSHLVVNTHEMMTGDFTRNADFMLPLKRMKARLAEAVAEGNAHFVDATKVARALMGDTIAANLFMLGVACQKGLVPLSAKAIEKAIELNGVSVPFNLKAFAWGRLHAQDEALVMARAAAGLGARSTEPMSLDQLVAHRAADLASYQSTAYARRYRALVEWVAAVDPGPDKVLSMAVARNAYKLMAYKDEYEVARLYTDGRFEKALSEQFTGDLKLRLQMAPPIFSRRDKETGHLQKRTIGPWMLRAMKVLVRMKGLRGTPFDLFGRSAERRMERALIADYFATIEALLPQLPEADYAVALALASLPETIRGYGHVKAASVEAAAARRADLLGRLVPAASVLSRAG